MKINPLIPSLSWVVGIAVQILVLIETFQAESSLLPQLISSGNSSPQLLGHQLIAELLPRLLPFLLTSFGVGLVVLVVVCFTLRYCLSQLTSFRSKALESALQGNPVEVDALKSQLSSISIRDPIQWPLLLGGVGAINQLVSLYSLELGGSTFELILSLAFLGLLLYLLYHVESTARRLHLLIPSGEVPERGLGLYVVLSIITVGLFLIYWLYAVVKDVNALA